MLYCAPREEGRTDLTKTRRLVLNSTSASSIPRDADWSLDMGMVMIVSSVGFCSVLVVAAVDVDVDVDVVRDGGGTCIVSGMM